MSALGPAVALLAALGLTLPAPALASETGASAPPVTAGLELYVNAGAELEADGEPVARWHDLSGAGRDLTAGRPDAAPIMRRDGGGGAALEFDGVRSLLKTYDSSFRLSQPTTIFIDYQALDDGSSGRAFVLDSRNSSVRQAFGRPSPGAIRLYADQDLDFPGVAYPFNGPEVWSGTADGRTSTIYRDGALVGKGNAGGAALEGLAVGALSTSDIWGYDYAHARVSAVLVYSGALDDADRTAVTDWLEQREAATAAPAPPRSVSPPALSGRAEAGRSLQVSAGTWAGDQPRWLAYAWERCAGDSASCSDLPGADTDTYTLGPADVGSTIRAMVTATNGAGSETVATPPSAVVADPAALGDGPPVRDGLELSFDADTLTAPDGGTVLTWPDRSGHGRDLAAFDAGAAPVFHARGLGGRGAVEFDGTGSLLKTYAADFTLHQPTTFFLVAESLDGPGGGGAILDSRNSLVRQVFGRGAGEGTMLMYADLSLDTPALDPGGGPVWSGTFDGPHSSLWRGDDRLADGGAGGSDLEGLTVGGLSTSGQYGYAFSHVMVGAILWYSGAMGPEDRADVTHWLAARYGG